MVKNFYNVLSCLSMHDVMKYTKVFMQHTVVTCYATSISFWCLWVSTSLDLRDEETYLSWSLREGKSLSSLPTMACKDCSLSCCLCHSASQASRDLHSRRYLPSLAAFRYFSLACPVSTSAILCGWRHPQQKLTKICDNVFVTSQC